MGWGLSIAGIFLLKRDLHDVRAGFHHINSRLNYHAVALAHNDIIPMPWEIEELEEIEKKMNIEKEGNVVYLNPQKTE